MIRRGQLFLGFALIGSWLGVNMTSSFSVSQFLTSVSKSVMPGDILFFVLKSTIPGALVFMVACHKGLSLKAASYEVPIVTNHAVVDAFSLALVAQFILSLAFYAIYGIDL